MDSHKSFDVDTPVNSYKLSLGIENQPQASHINHRGGFGSGFEPSFVTNYTGDKFPGGFGPTKLYAIDYWTLRQRSNQLFRDNLYARGIISRLVTNEINTGLTPESTPDEDILEVEENSLDDWTESVENRFLLWGKNPETCDWLKQNTFGSIQRTARMEALISGDVLVRLRRNQRTGLPSIQLISGEVVQTPLGGDENLRKGHTIKHGVEMNAAGRVVAYWINQKNFTSKRLPAFGEKSGRRIAWLVFGTEKRLDDIRGEPMLSIVLQSLLEIDRYRDSTQRKALINSLLAAQVIKTENKPGSLPMAGGAVSTQEVSFSDSDGQTRDLNLSKYLPGLVVDELQFGEEIKLMGGNGTDLAFGEFEEAVIQAIAWANEIPPEILRLSFSNNYSASQAAINEFKIYLNKQWSKWGETFCSPIYVDWLISETLSQRISAVGFLEAWRDPMQYDKFAAWISVEWYGSIKPSTDMLKQAKGSKMAIDEGWSTNAREARGLTGTKFSKNIKRLRRENEMKAEMIRPLLELKQEFALSDNENSSDKIDTAIEAILEDYLGELGIEHG